MGIRNKRVYLYFIAPRMHSSLKLMIKNPPEGYEFLMAENKAKMSLLSWALNSRLIKIIYKKVIKRLLNPRSIYEKAYSTKIPENVDLVFSTGAALNINKPWVVEILDSPHSLAGYDYNLFIKNKNDIEKKLLSHFCKKIIIVNEASYKIMEKYFSKEVMNKAVLVRAAVELPKLNLIKEKAGKKQLQIIFIGSIANPDDFFIKGGLEVLETFRRISEEFDNVALVVRCKTPEDIKMKYKNVKNIKFIEENLRKREFVKLLYNSDICLNPGHIYPLMAALEPMSFGIPIIMLDTYGVRDYVKHMKNGILIKPSEKIKWYKDPAYPSNIRSREFLAEIKNVDLRVINDLYYAVKKLIENKVLRYKLGNNGRKMAETKFSIKTRNNTLRKVFNEALNDNFSNNNQIRPKSSKY